MRPECPVWKRGGHRLTIELAHERGEELQLDWLELAETPWSEPCYVLVGALSHSGRIRAVLSDGIDFAHLAGALDGVLRRLGGTTRSWRTDRMTALVEPGTDRLRPEAAELAKHYGVTVAVCPPRRAQQGRGRGQHPLHRALLVADRAGRRSGRGAALARSVVRRGRRPAPPRPAHRRAESSRGAVAATARDHLPGGAASGADRLLHHGTVLTINGPSYRMRRHHERVETLRLGLQAAPAGK